MYLPTEELIRLYIETGRVAYLHKRKRTVSLNGFPALPEQQAREKMIHLLTTQKGNSHGKHNL